MRKSVLTILAAVLLAGCASSAVQPQTLSTPNRSVQTVSEESEPAVVRNYGTLKETADTVADTIVSNNWEELSSLFQQDMRSDFSAASLQERIQTAAEGPYTIRETDPFVRDDLFGAVILFDTSSGLLEAAFTVNDAMELNAFACALRPERMVEPEETDDWREMLVTVGNAPSLYGILTLPKEEEDAPIAILMPEELDDAMNESGSNETFRKDLAHQLAEHGIASVRFDMRLAEDPVITSVFGWRFAQLVSEDFAAIAHSLELYPVNASKIVYIGHGTAGALGYGLVRQHFEITGGLVLINAPFETDGAQLFARAAWLDEETSKQVAEALESEESETQELAGYPLSWWKEWQAMGALRYTRYVAIPILIQQGEADEIVSFKEDYDNWKSQKGSNVTMKSYKAIGHDLRNEDGEFDPQFAEDIADWLDGVDINKKKEEKDAKTTTSTTATTTAGKR